MSEQWKAIPGYEGVYEVSDQGRVRRIARGQGARPGHILRQTKGRQGYMSIGLRPMMRVRKTHKVHQLVSLAFLGPCPEGHEINHKNGIKHDNRPSNLEYVTPQENTRHAIQVLGRTGPTGERHASAKLTERDVLAIRSAPLTFTDARKLAAKFNVAPNTIWKAYQRKTWRHVA